MSTTENFLSHEEIHELTRDMREDTSIIYGEEDQEFGIKPYITFYIYHQDEEVEQLANQIIDIYEEFESQIIDKPFKRRYRDTGAWKNATKWKPSRQDLISEMHQSFKKYPVYFIGATTGDSPVQSARWAFCAQIFDNQHSRYTTLKLSFSEKWYKAHRTHWDDFVQQCLTKLKPIQAYSGYEIGNSTNFNIVSPEFEIVERIFADYFYGLDIDHPNMNHSHDDLDGFIYSPSLAAGIRPPTWCFLLSPYWLEKLGLTEAQIRLKLSDPRIEITKLVDPIDASKFSLWIRLGELSLYPVEDGVPELLVMANELIKPIRCNELKLTTTDAWDDDPNPRFDIEDSPQWIARFDQDSDWPQGKRVSSLTNSTADTISLSIKAGERCPKSGYWLSVAEENSRQYFKQGEVLPMLAQADWGEVYWQFDGEE